MTVLAVVDVLNSVPPGAPVPEGGVLFSMPAALVWLVGLGLAVAVGMLFARAGAGPWQRWRRRVRRLRRSLPRVAPLAVDIRSARAAAKQSPPAAGRQIAIAPRRYNSSECLGWDSCVVVP